MGEFLNFFRSKKLRKGALVLMFTATLAACEHPGTETSVGRSFEAGFQDVHLCAVGYDMARSFAQKVQIRGTIVKAPRKQTRCEGFAIDYLRRAGYAVEETAGKGEFGIELFSEGQDTAIGVAKFGNGIIISRHYRSAPTGVFALTPPNVIVADGGVL
ncbi:hypothetical protein WG622_17280 [Cognatishimia sp. D5M38]|uniref:Lipoprotein n=1 Tax=Cognatishimia coralii TaxID=3083254 RepID=A0ABU8QKQ0_9RHOB